MFCSRQWIAIGIANFIGIGVMSVVFAQNNDSQAYQSQSVSVIRGKATFTQSDIPSVIESPKRNLPNSSTINAFLQKGFWYEDRGDISFALVHLKNAYTLARESEYPLTELGEMAFRIGRLSVVNQQYDVSKRYLEYAARAARPEIQQHALSILSSSQLKQAKSLISENVVDDTEITYEARQALSEAIQNNPESLKVQQVRLWLETQKEQAYSVPVPTVLPQVTAFQFASAKSENPENGISTSEDKTDHKQHRFHRKQKPKPVQPIPEVTYSKSDYQNAMNHTATSVSELFTQGEMLLDRFQYQMAAPRLNLAVDTTMTKSDAMTLGDMLCSVGIPEVALKAYQRAGLLGAPEDLVALGVEKANRQISMAERFSVHSENPIKSDKQKKDKTNQRQWTQDQLLQALKQNQQNLNVHYALANLYEKQSYTKLALDHYYACLQLLPADLAPKDKSREQVLKKMAKLSSKK